MNKNKALAGGRTRAASGFLLVTCLLPLASAQSQFPTVQRSHASTFLNGGIGEDEVLYMQRVARDWPLRLTFSESAANNFIADVEVLVSDLQGTPCFQLTQAGPMTFVNLPAGKYRVLVQRHGVPQTRIVTLDGRRAYKLNFHWAESPQ